MDVLDTIKQQIGENTVILYMKGSPSAPQCGFSMRASQALMACGHRFAYVDILTNPEIRSELPKFANWPTFPQLWVKGELRHQRAKWHDYRRFTCRGSSY
jgi:monothiol glutaredoxin